MTNERDDWEEPRDAKLAAERMRRHRQRQRKGLRCLRIELHEMEIHELIRRGGGGGGGGGGWEAKGRVGLGVVAPKADMCECLAIERERGSVEAIYCGRSLLCRPTFGAEAREAQT